MIWQDPVDYGYITYEYDITMLENEDIGSEAKKLTCRACKVLFHVFIQKHEVKHGFRISWSGSLHVTAMLSFLKFSFLDFEFFKIFKIRFGL